MTIGELIEKLEAFDPEQNVCIMLDGSEGVGICSTSTRSPQNAAAKTPKERRSRKPSSASIRLKPASNPSLNRGPRIRITLDDMEQATKESVNWQEYAPARNCENCQYGRCIDVYQYVYRCVLNDWNTGALSICDKWTEKAE